MFCRNQYLITTLFVVLSSSGWIYVLMFNQPKIEVITNDVHATQSIKEKPVLFTPLASKTLKPAGVAPPNDEFERIWNYVYNQQYHCTENEYIGGKGDFSDGAYDLCTEERFFPRSRDSSYKCLVYSFGVGGDFSFDDAIARKGCEVHSFDPSTNFQDGLVRDSGVTFHKVGISDEDNDNGFNGWKMRTLKTLIKELGHTGRYLDYLKVDTDKPDGSGFEDVIMEELLTTGLHKCVRQYAMEIHMHVSPQKPEWVERCRTLYRQMTKLNDFGWRLYNTTDNVRSKLLKDSTYTMRNNRELFFQRSSVTFLWEVAFVNFDVERPCHV